MSATLFITFALIIILIGLLGFNSYSKHKEHKEKLHKGKQELVHYIKNKANTKDNQKEELLNIVHSIQSADVLEYISHYCYII